jgi:hypothetical protein
MRTHKRFVCLLVIPLLALLRVNAQEGARPQPPAKYRMELIYIFDTGSTEFIFVIGNVGFKSVTSLKNFVGNLPAGSTLEWAPGCRRLGGEPFLSSEQEIADFKVFCEKRDITFILVPSG